MKKISKRTAVVVVATAAASIATGGIAVAYWSTNGSGSATAAAGNALGVKGVATPGTSGTLYPNASLGAVISITNPNSFPVKVTRIQAAAGSLPTTLTGNASCTAGSSVVTIGGDTGPLAAANQLSIPANGTITPTVPALQIAMGLASDNSCQGAGFQFGSDTVAGPIVITAQAG